MDGINFRYNYDALDLAKLHKQEGITQQAMVEIVEKPSFRLRSVDGPKMEATTWIKIEYSSKLRQIILVAFKCDGDTIFFVGAKVADQDEIDQYYCGQ